jgi:hypothetical protein
MCCSSPPPPPDLSGVSEASEEVARMNQQTAREQLDWAREQDTNNRALLQEVLDIQLPAMREQFETAQADRQRYEEFYRPFEDAFAEEAANYDTPERRERERGGAIADVNTQFDASRRNALQRLEGYGVDPSATRNQALDVGVRTQQAMAQAQAGTNANRRVEDIGRALKSDVINMGRGALSNAAGFYGQAVGAGSSATGNALNTTQSGAGAVQSGLGFSNAALAGYGQSAGIQTQGYQNQMAGFNAEQQQTAGMLSAVGGAAGMFMADGGEVEGLPSGAMAAQGRVGDPRYQQQGLPQQGGSTEQGYVDERGMGNGSGIDDRVPAQLSEGEFVIPADVVRAKGEEFFEKLLERYHVPANEQRAN